MDFDEIKDQLKEFNYYKQLILHDETDGRNIIVETKDGVCRVLPQKIKGQLKGRKVKINPIPGLAANLDQIERITIFVDGQEYEFVACQ